MKSVSLKYSLILFYGALLYFISYQVNRGDFLTLILLVLGCGGVYFAILKNKWFSIKEILFLGILLRVVVLFNEPNLSDDYYRFLWDGEMINQGLNPYLVLPSEAVNEQAIQGNEFLMSLYHKMNSPNYYTVYPPVNQTVYSIAAFFSGNNIYVGAILIKLMLLLFEIGVIFFLFRLLAQLKKPHYLANIYVFNPLILLEVVGNAHFEGVMVFFLIASVSYLIKEKLLFGAILMGLAINTKLLPLMLLPLFFKYLGVKKSIQFYLLVGASVVLMFLPFYSWELFQNMGASVNLYFQNFEFNASFHYLVRYVSLSFFDSYRFIAFSGYVFSFFVFGLVMYKTFWSNQSKKMAHFFVDARDIFFVFLLLASTVHPWYLIGLVAFSVFTESIYILVWSIVIMFSYFAYSYHIQEVYNWDKHQSNWYFILIFIEYLVVFIAYALRIKSKKLLSH